ncbi:MAG: hypothetical protein OXS28_17890 [Gammaproteobacteria bacterium]|nr:hypothetical protein [Gammaproteobacteria bacterium]
METTMNNLPPDTAIPAEDARQESPASQPERRAGRPDDDLVRWREFRLALWIGGFALAAILGGQGFLYSAIMGLQGEMHAQIGGLRIEVNTQIDGLRTEMNTKIDDLRADMQAQFAYVHERVDELSERIHVLSERVARIETRLDIAADPASDLGG